MDWSTILFWIIVVFIVMVALTFAVTLAIVITIFNDVRRDHISARERVDRVRRHL